MTQILPDVALDQLALAPAPLDWVGMQHIDVPLRLEEPGIAAMLHARADVQVDLPDPRIKGIHMSRLYRLLDGLAPCPLTPGRLAESLQAMVRSHADCHSTRARLRLTFSLLCQRPALVSEGLVGWKAYPVQLDAEWREGVLSLGAKVSVTYSSTCPCSAALSRQLLEQAFTAAFGEKAVVDPRQVGEWLRDHGSVATPHSQRSVAEVTVPIAPDAPALGLMTLVDRVEAALGTAVQAAVKRADEQAFARLNGQHLMYVEDAARKVRLALVSDYPRARVFVRHAESLHPHDAVAWA